MTNDKGSGNLRIDSLSASLLLLLGLTVVQRLIGFGRNLFFCHALEDGQLGRWSLAYSFLLVTAPIVVLGVPGSFGRYVEHYRQKGQLKTFLRRTMLLSAGAATLATLLMAVRPGWFASLLYDNSDQVRLVQLLALVLLGVILFNFVVELLMALRLVRFASMMQLSSSAVFALVGIALLQVTGWGEYAALLSYGVAASVGAAIGVVVVVWYWKGLPADEAPVGQRELWVKLFPFAFWIWAGDLLGNLFEVADQFMLKHFSGLTSGAADSLVGQYYSSRVVPLLLVSVACMFASSLLPHLSSDWESGRQQAVRRRVQMTVKLAGILFTLAAALVLVAAPLLFRIVLRGKYEAGLAVMPGTLTYCVWYCIACVAISYLWCVERALWGSLALLIGLMLNVMLNYLLAPRFGLSGVVAATAIANAAGLVCILAFSRRAGLVLDGGVVLAGVLPLSLLLGGGAALAITAVIAATAAHYRWVFTRRETWQLRHALTGFLSWSGFVSLKRNPAAG